jgi:hypothetical protein
MSEGTYRGRTAAQWREEERACYRLSAESFERCDTDGFLSQWANDVTGRKYAMYARVAEQGGTWEFRAVFDLAGNLLDAREVEGRYGYVWLIKTGDTVTWFNESRARKGVTRLKNDTAKGFRLGTVRRPAYVGMSGNRTSLNPFVAPDRDSNHVEVVDNGSLGTQYQDED